MPKNLQAWFAFSLALALGACGDDGTSPDGSTADSSASAGTDAALTSRDAASDAPAADSQTQDSAAAMDASALPLAGFGTISGTCGVIDQAMLDSTEPSFFVNSIDFGTMPYSEDYLDMLSAGSQEMFRDGNAGGSSLYSEMFAYELLYRCELATLLKTETEITYDTPGSITDFLAEVDGKKVGVSVTRAYVYPPDQPYTVESATMLLQGKLSDILESSANVSDKDAWVKQILHIIAYAPMHAESLMAAHAALDPAVRSNTIVVVTVSEGDDEFLY